MHEFSLVVRMLDLAEGAPMRDVRVSPFGTAEPHAARVVQVQKSHMSHNDGVARANREAFRGVTSSSSTTSTSRRSCSGSPFGMRVFDAAVPSDEFVAQYGEMLGIDPMLAANEGKVLVIVAPEQAGAALAAMRAHPYGRDAAIIGDIVRKPQGVALVETAYGSRRLLEMPIEEQLPRIC